MPASNSSESNIYEYPAELLQNLIRYKSDDMLGELRKITGEDIEIELLRYEPGQGEPGGIPMPLLMPGITDGRHSSRLGIQIS